MYFSNFSTVDKQFDQCMFVLMNVAIKQEQLMRR